MTVLPRSGGFVSLSGPRLGPHEIISSKPTTSVFGVASLGEREGLFQGEIAAVPFHTTTGDGGGGTFMWDPYSTAPADGGLVFGARPSGRWLRVFSGAVDVSWFGAVGNDDQTLIAWAHTQQAFAHSLTHETRDGIAIYAAIDSLRARGGGTLYLPRGTYRVFGFLSALDFPVRVVGDGIGATVIKNCDASPTVHGYGIFWIRPLDPSAISIENLTVDGNCGPGARPQPTAEFVCYPIAVYGKPRLRLMHVESKNSPIDCLGTMYENDDSSSLQAVSCTFSNAFRNTASLVSGCNQQFTNCIFEKGGKVHGGTSPGYCLDIEPDSLATTLQRITFTNCIFREALAVIIAGVWSQASFDGCTIDAGPATRPSGGTWLPWAGDFSGGQFSFTGCKFIDAASHRGFLRLGYQGNGPFLETQHVDIRNCSFEGVGINCGSAHLRMSNVDILNSGFPCYFSGGASTPHSLVARNINLVNVVDAGNAGSGMVAAFGVAPNFRGSIEVDGLTARIVPQMLPVDSYARDQLKSQVGFAYGVFINPTLADTSEGKVCNVHAAGYRRKYVTAFGVVASTAYMDWHRAGTGSGASDGGTATAPPADASGVAAGPGTIFYKNCTHYGDSD